MRLSDVNVLAETIENARRLASAFLANPSDANCQQLNVALKSLADNTKTIVPTSFLLPNDPRLSAFVEETKLLLLDEQCDLVLRSRLCILLHNLCLFNAALRRSIAAHSGFCGAIYETLKRVIEEKIGTQCLIDVLRVLQLLTYERNFVVGNWTYELLGYLVAEILRSPEVEWLPHCIAVLCNLLARSKTVCGDFIQRYYQTSRVPKRLMELLSNDSRLVVVCTLLIFGHLNTAATSTIFSPENLSQVLLCGFNVLLTPDHLLCVQYAADYLSKILFDEREEGVRLSELARNYPTFGYFRTTLETLNSLLVNLDPRSEEAAKIFELSETLARVFEIRSAVCSSILHSPTFEVRKGPVHAIIRAAQMAVEETPLQRTPIAALKLLDLLVKEAIEENTPLRTYFDDPMLLVSIVEANVKTPVATKSDLVVFQCLRISESLKLAQTLAGDKTANEQLSGVLTASLCSHLNETQRITNGVISRVCSPQSSFASSASSDSNHFELCEWNRVAISIPLELIRLLAILKDHSRLHKDLYWRTLEDERVLPFIAFAITQGTHEQVMGALQLIPQFGQNVNFSWSTLTSLVRNCSRSLGGSTRRQNGFSLEQLGSFSTLASSKE
ncbi:hypothetical protein M3Y99_00727200 [Aphelenchoides fujianensis]|nr:hypothetical protein M3Y99_00727200 [Aphelenchoides fujianensis]